MLFLLPFSSALMETRIPGGPHIKTIGIPALGFQANITHFLCCLRDRGHSGLSQEDLPPRYRLPPAHHHPIPQEPLKANVSQGGKGCRIPSKGQLVVVTGESLACLRQKRGALNLFEYRNNQIIIK